MRVYVGLHNLEEALLCGHPFCNRNVAFQEGHPLIRDRIVTFMIRLSLISGLSKGVELSLRWPLKRGSTVSHPYIMLLPSVFVTLSVFVYVLMLSST